MIDERIATVAKETMILGGIRRIPLLYWKFMRNPSSRLSKRVLVESLLETHRVLKEVVEHPHFLALKLLTSDTIGAFPGTLSKPKDPGNEGLLDKVVCRTVEGAHGVLTRIFYFYAMGVLQPTHVELVQDSLPTVEIRAPFLSSFWKRKLMISKCHTELFFHVFNDKTIPIRVKVGVREIPRVKGLKGVSSRVVCSQQWDEAVTYGVLPGFFFHKGWANLFSLYSSSYAFGLSFFLRTDNWLEFFKRLILTGVAQALERRGYEQCSYRVSCGEGPPPPLWKKEAPPPL